MRRIAKCNLKNAAILHSFVPLRKDSLCKQKTVGPIPNHRKHILSSICSPSIYLYCHIADSAINQSTDMAFILEAIYLIPLALSKLILSISLTYILLEQYFLSALLLIGTACLHHLLIFFLSMLPD